MKIFAVRSRQGARAAFLLFQSYGLLLFYLFVGSIGAVTNPNASSAEPILDLVSLVLLLPVLIMMESVMISEIRLAIQIGNRAGARQERVKQLMLAPLSVLYIVLLFKPELAGLADARLSWTIAYQILHLASAVTLGEAMRKTPASSPPGERGSPGGVFVMLGLFAAASALIPGAPFRTFVALGSTFLTWGLALLLVDDYREPTRTA